MVGRAAKGLFITTGRFTKDAEREAVRDGAPAIDLIDGIHLCNVLKSLGLGVGTTTVVKAKAGILRGPLRRTPIELESDSVSRPGPYAAPPAQSQARVPRGLPTPTNSHVVQPRLTKSREFSGRPTRGNSRIEGTRPVRSGLPPPPSRLPNLDREETRRVFSLVSGALPESGATRDAREARKEQHFRVRSRLLISGGSVCANGFPVGVPFALQWPPMAVWVESSGVTGVPSTYEVDGVQYVAVLSGWGVDAARKQDLLNPLLGTSTYVPQGGVLWVFSLPDQR